MKTALQLFLLLLPLFAAGQEVIDASETIVQLVQPNVNYRIYLLAKPVPGRKQPTHYLKVVNISESRETNHSLRAVVDTTALCAGWPNQKLHIFFANERLGFLYGSAMGYGYCLFMFRTTDGGRSWARVQLDPKHQTAPAYREGLFMFNEKQGMALAYTVKSLLYYYVTSDGGLTWTPKTVKISEKDVSSHSQYLGERVQPYYSANGNVVLVVKEANSIVGQGRLSSTFPVLKSDDFGRTFRVMK